MVSDGEILLQGPGPYSLPCAQRTTATANKDNGVDVTFYILADGRDQRLSSVCIQMTSRVALKLAGQLAQAAAKAETE